MYFEPFYSEKENISKDIFVNVELESEINELFAKTKVIQKFTNTSKDSLELKINIYKKKV